MAWFKRKKVDAEVLPELEQYYEAEKRERAGLAWLLALVSVACAILIIIGITLGGKWIYNRFTDKQTATTNVQTTSNGSTPKGNNQLNTNDEDTKTSGSNTKTSTATKPSKPVKNPNDIPNTGPGNVAAVFVVSAAVAGLGHHLVLRRKTLL